MKEPVKKWQREDLEFVCDFIKGECFIDIEACCAFDSPHYGIVELSMINADTLELVFDDGIEEAKKFMRDIIEVGRVYAKLIAPSTVNLRL